MSAATELRRMVNGYQLAQALHVAAVLRLSDHVVEGPRTAAELAAMTGAHEDSLARLLRALAAAGVYSADAAGRYANTELGAQLRDDAPGSVAGWARLIGRPYYWQAWSGLLDSVRTGENAFAAQHGESIWAYRANRPDEGAIFDGAMTSLSAAVSRAVVDAYDFGPFSTVVDIGGGRGGLLAAILARWPHLHGVLFDQPAVVEAAPAMERCERVGGSFFDAVPEGDAYVLKAVIHDWPDEESIAILRRVRDTMPEHAVVLLLEQLLDAGPDPLRTALSDLNMLVAPGGRERTREQYAALLTAAGLRMARVVPTASHVFVVEAVGAADVRAASSPA